MKLKKTIRRLSVVLAAVLLIGVVFWLVAQRIAKSKVVGLLEEITGGRVEVDAVNLGFETTSVRGIRVFESGGGEVWLAVDAVQLDLSIWEALGGKNDPEFATIRGAVLKLKYDAKGKLLTEFPQSDGEFQLPTKRIDIVDARVEIHQRQRDPLIADNIDARIQGTQDIRIDGSVGDLLSANWKLAAQVNAKSLAATIQANTDVVRLSSEQIASLPLVPPGLTSQSRFSGVTPVKLSLSSDERGELNYRLDLTPSSLDLAIPEANLDFTNARGSIVATDDFVEFNNLAGNWLDGQFTISGRFSLQEDSTWRGKAQATVTGVSLAKLPKDWSWPQDIKGLASTNGEVDLAIAGSKVDVQGRGLGTVVDANLRSVPAQPIQVRWEFQKARDAQLTGHADAQIEFRDVAVLDLIKAVDPESEIAQDALRGHVSVQMALNVPFASAGDPRTYRAKAMASSPAVQFENLPVRDVRGSVHYAGGVATIRDLQAKIGDQGQVTGTADLQLAPQRDLITSVNFRNVPASLVAQLVGQPADTVQANVSGTLQAAAPIDKLGHLQAWKATGSLWTDELLVNQQRITKAAANVTFAQRTLALKDVQATWQDIAIGGSASVRMKPPFAFEARMAVRDVDIKTVEAVAKAKLPFQVAGHALVQGRVSGTLDPLAWRASGNAELSELVIEEVEVASPVFDWSVEPRLLRVSDARAEVFGGSVEVAAEIPLDGSAPSSICGFFAGVDPTTLPKLPPEIPVLLTGAASGEFHVTGIEKLATAAGQISIRGAAVTAQELQLDQSTASLSLEDGRLDLQADGKMFGGKVSLTGTARLVELESKRVGLGQISGRIDADKLQLSQLWRRLAPDVTPTPPEGIAKLGLEVELVGSTFQPQGKGQLELRDLRWNGKSLSPLVKSGIELPANSKSIVLNNIASEFGGGRVAGSLQLRTDKLGTGTYAISLKDVETSKLLQLWPKWSRGSKGAVSAAFRGHFANERIEGSGRMQLSRAELGDVPVNNLHAPVTWMMDTTRGTGKANVRLDRAEVARGRVSGRLDIDWGRQINVAGKAKLENVDLRSLRRKLQFVPDQFDGRLSGNVEMAGRNVRSINDLSGTFQAKLQNSPMLQLPILDPLANSFGIGSPAQLFSNSEVKGRMHRGTVNIDRLTMVSSTARLFVEGKVTTRGQIDLDVTADTAQTLAVGVAVGLLRPADLLRRRLIFLHVGGTTRSPSVLPQTEKLIRQEIVLFFLPFGRGAR